MLDHMLWENIVLQQAATTSAGETVAIVQVAGANMDNGYAALELLVHPEHVADVDAVVGDFLDRVFRELPLRKLCLSAVEDELCFPPCLQPTAKTAGRLTAHERRSDEVYVDVVFYEIWREDWDGR